MDYEQNEHGANWCNIVTGSNSKHVSVYRVSIGSDTACRLFGAKPLSKPPAGLLSIGPFGTSFNKI